MIRALLVITAVMLVLSVALSGGAGLGRVMLAAGAPGLAAKLFEDPAWRGVALYRAQDYAQAAEAFEAGKSYYNLGTALARNGAYSAALETYDRVIPGGDEDAATNFDLIAAYYAGLEIEAGAFDSFGKRDDGPTAEADVAQGNARAAGTGDEATNKSTMMGNVQVLSREQNGVRRIFDDRFMLADERWLEQLSDVPGEYLDARIKFEFKRRAKLGLTPPEPEDKE